MNLADAARPPSQGSEATPPTSATWPDSGVTAASPGACLGQASLPVASQAVGCNAEQDSRASASCPQRFGTEPAGCSSGDGWLSRGRSWRMCTLSGPQPSREGPDGKSLLLYGPDSLCLNLSDLLCSPKTAIDVMETKRQAWVPIKLYLQSWWWARLSPLCESAIASVGSPVLEMPFLALVLGWAALKHLPPPRCPEGRGGLVVGAESRAGLALSQALRLYAFLCPMFSLTRNRVTSP